MKKSEFGQSLVETALIAPILIFLLIGVFEVGWVLRTYLVLANANREAARFAVRPNYVDYDNPDYMPIINHFEIAVSDQVPFFEEGGTLIVSRVKVDTQYVCDPEQHPCDCDQAVTDPFSPTLYATPLDIPTYTFTYPTTSTEKSRLDYPAILNELVVYNRRHSCNLFNHNYTYQKDEAITIEFIFHQHQLFGFPLLSNPYSDPVPLYGHSTFRRLLLRE